MTVTGIIKKRAEHTFKQMCNTPVEIVEKTKGVYDKKRGISAPKRKQVWKGLASFQPYHEKFRDNPGMNGGTAIIKSDARVYVPFSALNTVKSNELVFIVNGQEYTPDLAPVDVGNLNVYYQIEITGSKGE
jgi:hypothetical protein